MSKESAALVIKIEGTITSISKNKVVGEFIRTFEGKKANREALKFLKLVRKLQYNAAKKTVTDRARNFNIQSYKDLYEYYSDKKDSKGSNISKLAKANDLSISITITNNYGEV